LYSASLSIQTSNALERSPVIWDHTVLPATWQLYLAFTIHAQLIHMQIESKCKVKQVVADTNRLCNVMHHTQSSSCCAQSWMLSVINRRRSTVDNTWRQSDRYTHRPTDGIGDNCEPRALTLTLY